MVVSTIDAVHLNALSSSSLHSLFYDRHNTQHTLNDTLNDEHERQISYKFPCIPTSRGCGSGLTLLLPPFMGGGGLVA